MDELHKAAIAYYNNGTAEQQRLAWQFFRAMDANNDGRVSLQEYINFLCQTAGLAWVRREMFYDLDRDRDGQLDFWEVLTLYYVAKSRTISCRSCFRSLNVLYFTCVTCFDTPCNETFDLCLECYSLRTYTHPHYLFLDSFVLLRSRRHHDHPIPMPLDSQNLTEQEPSTVCLALAQQEPAGGWSYAFKAMEFALLAGNLSTFCTIM